jgi:DNA-binding transcriptional MerR regulator
MTANAHNANYRMQAGHESSHRQEPGAELGMGASPLYSVSQLARQLGVTARTIRFYEDKGLVAPSRAGTTRVYTHRDRARLMLILRGKRLGFSLREIKEFLDLYDMDPTQHTQMKQLLIGVRKRIAKLQEQRAALEQSLGELNEIERQAEAALKQRSA